MRVRGWVGDERERTRRRMETRWGRAASRWMVNGSWCVRGDGMRLDDFIQRFNFFLSEIIDSIRFDSIRFDSIRLEEDPCVVFDRLTISMMMTLFLFARD
jgi:hypothetical protein